MPKNLVKVTGIGEVKGRKGPPTLKVPSSFAIKIVFLKHVVLIMGIINVQQ